MISFLATVISAVAAVKCFESHDHFLAVLSLLVMMLAIKNS